MPLNPWGCNSVMPGSCYRAVVLDPALQACSSVLPYSRAVLRLPGPIAAP